jgi:hypothetical protein
MKERVRMNEEYFEWLLNIIGIDPEDQNGYGLLCSQLMDTAFYPILEMDENRWEDGIRYRYLYAMEKENGDAYRAGMLSDHLDDIIGGCSVLELMIAMADRMRCELEGSRYEANTGYWFRVLLGNLGLDIYTNNEYLCNEAAFFDVEKIVEKMVFRKYGFDGRGGLFPLQNPNSDQSKEEIATQMNNYLLENYDILG